MTIASVAKPALVRVMIGPVEVDATTSEEHSATNEITRHPVEKGARITDHIRPEAETLTLECLVANTPISEEAIRKYGPAPLGAPGRAEKALQDLMRLRNAGELVTVVTRIRTYEGMAIRSIRVPRNARTGDSLRFTIQLEQVREVQSETVQLARVAVPGGRGKVDTGQQVAKPATDAERRRSILDKLFFK